ncbi:MAG: META domain-containing protein [Flavobacteriales bacterium]|nr:META domain-containing protein [Flavobacteriales bacterium]
MKKLFICCILFAAFSCDTLKKGTSVIPSLNELTQNKWVLEAMNSKEVNLEDFAKGLPNLNFNTDGSMNGSTGCNTFTGKFNLAETFSMTPGAMSKMNCPGTGEKDFLDAISKVTNVNFSEGNLVMSDEKSELLKFVSQTAGK